eukprot:gnl/TRDRNA2_/TRDRNA2_193015_c0_seq1.p1 gnl/TRDRNA2_/TRDRNA2_193015_c0~~gnl/TRDRNA2_/TRDRNA2_193015_c0_seq1.p1  ORF type:complete len:113 (+),score=6.82 gnl/TRDRNA2_/TRDRNA2_193015_c0_seq1:152-490(+)
MVMRSPFSKREASCEDSSIHPLTLLHTAVPRWFGTILLAVCCGGLRHDARPGASVVIPATDGVHNEATESRREPRPAQDAEWKMKHAGDAKVATPTAHLIVRWGCCRTAAPA